MEIYLGRYIPIYTGASPVSNLLIYLVKDNHSKYILEGIYFPRYMPIYAGALKGVLAAASRDMVAFGTALALTHHTPHTTHHTPHREQCTLHSVLCIALDLCIALESLMHTIFLYILAPHREGGVRAQCIAIHCYEGRAESGIQNNLFCNQLLWTAMCMLDR